MRCLAAARPGPTGATAAALDSTGATRATLDAGATVAAALDSTGATAAATLDSTGATAATLDAGAILAALGSMGATAAALDSMGATVAAGAIVVVLGAFGRPRLTRPPRPAPAGMPDRSLGRRRVFARRTAAAAIAALLVVVLGWLVPAIGLLGLAAARALGPTLGERRRQRAAHRSFPDSVERVVLLVHAGLTPQLAVRDASHSAPPPVRPAFEAVVHRLDRGVPLGEALDALADVLGPRAAAVADAFGAADRYGLPLEPMLDQLAHDARAERRRLDEAAARRLPVRLTFPLVTCTLPSFVLVAIAPAVLAALSSLGGSTW